MLMASAILRKLEGKMSLKLLKVDLESTQNFNELSSKEEKELGKIWGIGSAIRSEKRGRTYFWLS